MCKQTLLAFSPFAVHVEVLKSRLLERISDAVFPVLKLVWRPILSVAKDDGLFKGFPICYICILRLFCIWRAVGLCHYFLIECQSGLCAVIPFWVLRHLLKSMGVWWYEQGSHMSSMPPSLSLTTLYVSNSLLYQQVIFISVLMYFV